MGWIDDAVGASMVQAVLRSVPAIPELSYKGHRFTSSDLLIIANLIQLRRIKLTTTQVYSASSYNHELNRLQLALDVAEGTCPSPSTIVHEAVHAVFDYRKMRGQASANEAVAYTVQAIYHAKTSDSRFNSEKAPKIYSAAKSAASTVMNGGASGPALAAVEKAILAHPVYICRGKKLIVGDGV